MRTDYPLYIVAMICFVAAIYAYITLPETQLYLYALAVLGIIFLGLGYIIRPKSTTIISAPTSQSSTELPPETKPEPKEELEDTSTKKQAQKKQTKRRRRKKKA